MFAVLWGKGCRCAGLAVRAIGLGFSLAAFAAGLAHPARADDSGDDTDPRSAHVETADGSGREIWSGGEQVGSTWAFYTGLTAAPGDLTQPGPRLRFAAGISTYVAAGSLDRSRAAQPFADLLAGYQWQLGAVTLKGFVGFTGAADIRTQEQALDLWGQARIGVKTVGEGWWTIAPHCWASLDVTFARPQAVLWSRVRYGQRVMPGLSLGPEAGVAGELSRLGGRLGAFARFEWAAGEVAASAGLAGSVSSSAGLGVADGPRTVPYLTLTWLQRF